MDYEKKLRDAIKLKRKKFPRRRRSRAYHLYSRTAWRKGRKSKS